MATVKIDSAVLNDIADEIRDKLDVETVYKPSQMPAAIASISVYPEPTGSINISTNGTTDVKDYASAVVNVPNSYASGDEGKVVSNGELVAQSSTTKNANGTYDTTLNDEVVINVPNSYVAADEGKVVSSGALVAQTSVTKTANGTYTTITNNEVVVAIPEASGEEF